MKACPTNPFTVSSVHSTTSHPLSVRFFMFMQVFQVISSLSSHHSWLNYLYYVNWKLCISLFCNFPQSFIISSLLGPYNFHNTLFPDTFNLCFFLRMRPCFMPVYIVIYYHQLEHKINIVRLICRFNAHSILSKGRIFFFTITCSLFAGPIQCPTQCVLWTLALGIKGGMWTRPLHWGTECWA